MLIARLMSSRLPVELRGPVRVRSSRTEQVDGTGATASGWGTVIEGEVAEPSSADGPLQVESRRVDEERTP